jgi:putative sterol carrier protein
MRGDVSTAEFPSLHWLEALKEKLNIDNHYNVVARKWEGDLYFDIRPEGNLKESVGMYLDLWHGSCRGVAYGLRPESSRPPKFVLTAKYGNFTSVLLGKLDPMTAMMTNRLKVDGNLGYMMRHVPTVLDFVRCAREITTSIL